MEENEITEQQKKEETVTEMSTTEKPEASWIWMKNSKGQPSASITFATIAFWVTTIAYIGSIFQKVGPIEFRSFDVAACSAYLVPVLGLYFGRRFVDAKQSN